MVQTLVPTSTVSAGSWSPGAYTDVNADDGTYAKSETVNAAPTSLFEVGLTNPSNPASGTCTLTVRWKADGGGGAYANGQCRFQANGSTIATITTASTLGTTEVEETTTFSTALVSDWENDTLTVEVQGTDVRRQFWVDYIELEIPDAGGSPGTATPGVTSAALTIPAAGAVNTDGGSVSVAVTSTSVVVPSVSLVGGGVVSPAATALSVTFPAVEANPTNVGGLPDAAIIGLYDARNVAGSVTDPVAAWSDEGPLSQDDIVQASGTLQPLITESGFGGVRALEFDGSDDYMTMSLASTYTGDFAIICAVEWLTDPDTSSYVIYSTGSGSEKNILGSDTEDDGKWVVMSGDGTQPAHHQATADADYLGDVPSRFVMTQLVRNAGEHRLWENGTLIVDESDSNPSGDLNDLAGLFLGCREDISRHANFRIGYLLFVDMSETDQTTLLAADAELRTAFNVTTVFSATATPAVTNAGLTIPAVSTAAPFTVSPDVLARSFTINTVTLVGGAVSGPETTALSAALPAPSLSGGGVVSPAATSTAFTIPQVSAQAGGATVTPDALVVSLTLPAVSPSGAGSTTPSQIGLSFAVNAVSLEGGGVASPGEIGLAFTVPTPSTITGGAGQASPAALTTAALLNAVSAVGGASVTVDDVTAVLTIPAASTSGGGVATPAQVATSAQLPAVSAVGPAVVSPDATTSSFLIPGVTVQGAASSEPGVVELTVTLPAPTLSNSDGGPESQEGELSVTYQEGGLRVTVQGSGLSVVEQSSGLEVSQ